MLRGAAKVLAGLKTRKEKLPFKKLIDSPPGDKFAQWLGSVGVAGVPVFSAYSWMTTSVTLAFPGLVCSGATGLGCGVASLLTFLEGFFFGGKIVLGGMADF